MKKGLFIFILCLSIMLIGCPAATSGDANDANGTNTGSNGGNGGSGNSGNGGGNGGSGTGNTGVIASVENEFVYYDNEKECYVGSVTWKATSPAEQAYYLNVDRMEFQVYDANNKKLGYILTDKEPHDADMYYKFTVKENSLVQYENNNNYGNDDNYGDNDNYGDDDYYDDYYGNNYSQTISRSNIGIPIYDIPGIVVKAILIINGQNAPREIKTQKGLVSKDEPKRLPKDGDQYYYSFVKPEKNDKVYKYTFDWMYFCGSTGIIPASVKLSSSLGVTGNESFIDWTSSDVLDAYCTQNPYASISIKKFQVKESEDEDENRIYTLSGDKDVNIPANDTYNLTMTVKSTRGKIYKFTNKCQDYSIIQNWTYTK